MRITREGQITIPAEIRQRLGLLPDTEVEFEVREDGLYLRKKLNPTRGSRLIELMQGKATGKLTTDQIMAMTRQDEP
jgi:AbrB family looped-hinge helix DNA binding protein